MKKLSPGQRRTAAALRGKTIKSVSLHVFGDSNGGTAATDPMITFTDGTVLGFSVQETELGEYGVTLIYSRVRP